MFKNIAKSIATVFMCCAAYLAPAVAQEWEELIQRLPVTVVEDPEGDLILDHPVFERIFDIRLESVEEVPGEVDIIAAAVERVSDFYHFSIRTRGQDVGELLAPGRQHAQYGFYIDADVDGRSDLLLLTAGKPGVGVLVTTEFDIVAELDLAVEPGGVVFRLPTEFVGDTFDWSAFSGFTPRPGAAFGTPVDTLFYFPEIDWLQPTALIRDHPLNNSMTEHFRTIQESGRLSVVFSAQQIMCPPATAEYSAWYKKMGLVPIPGYTQNGVLLQEELWPLQNYLTQLYCSGSFTRYIKEPTQDGFMARCPFPCGANMFFASRGPGGQPIGYEHTIYDKPVCKGQNSYDNDGDGLLDVMRHRFFWAHSNPAYAKKVESCNIERALTKSMTGQIKATRCCPPRKLYSAPFDPPGSINGTPPYCP
jgi:hypothetical protein